MKLATILVTLALSTGPAVADTSVSTLVTTPLVVEGLTHDGQGNLYTPARTPGAGLPCPVWRIPIHSPSLTLVGQIPAPSETTQCSPSGLAFGPDGMLYVAETDRIYRFTPDAASPPTATVFATGVPGTNGVAFDRRGALWTGDGTTGLGRVWRISRSGVVTEAFRVPPMFNSAGVGREIRPGPTGNPQPLVANGLAFDRRGDLVVADTARGALWTVRIGRDGRVAARTGCDTTLTPNTLCLDELLVAHPRLEGADGIALDAAGNVWTVANERNAILFTDRSGRTVDVFRNPADPATQLRNAGPLEFPTSPVLAGRVLCTANSDGNRRDNSPNAAGELDPAGAARGKISCLDQRASVPALPLPPD